MDCDRRESSGGNDTDLINLLLSSKLHTLAEEDRKILDHRELLKNELYTLQNADPDLVNDAPKDVRPIVEEVAAAANTDYRDELSEFELLTDPSTIDAKGCEIGGGAATIVSLIRDRDIKSCVEELNVKIEINLLCCRDAMAEAKALIAEKVVAQRALSKIENEIKNYSVEEAKIKRMKRKRGMDSAYTGVARNTYFCRFGAPYFKTGDYFNADRNADYQEIMRSGQKMVSMMPRVRRFLPLDGRRLGERVLEQLKTKRVAKLRRNLKQLTQLGGDDDTVAEQKRNILAAIAVTEKVKNLQETVDWKVEVDFMALGSDRYSSEDYERLWRLMGDPALSKDNFSDEEMARLRDLVEEHGAQDWDRLATLLGGHRSGFVCFTKYMMADKRGRNLSWSRDEDERLTRLCRRLADIEKEETRTLWWRYIRRQFPQRTYAQLFAHWKYVLQPHFKKGRFTSDEHARVERLRQQGKSYTEIASIVKNRSCVQIRAHFEATSDEKKGQWRQTEEELLLALVDKYGTHSWKRISLEMKTRNRSQCRLKYMLLTKNAQPKRSETHREYWSLDEERRFNELLDKYGPRFDLISAELKGRSFTQCRYKYFRMRKKNGVRGRRHTAPKSPQAAVVGEAPVPEERELRVRWTLEEVKLFTRLVEKYGRNYEKISQELKTKSYKQCRDKYFTMERSKKKPNDLATAKTEAVSSAEIVSYGFESDAETISKTGDDARRVTESNSVPKIGKRKKAATKGERKSETKPPRELSRGSKRRKKSEKEPVSGVGGGANRKETATETNDVENCSLRMKRLPRNRKKQSKNDSTDGEDRKPCVDGERSSEIRTSATIPRMNAKRRKAAEEIEQVEQTPKRRKEPSKKKKQKKSVQETTTVENGDRISKKRSKRAIEVAEWENFSKNKKPKLSRVEISEVKRSKNESPRSKSKRGGVKNDVRLRNNEKNRRMRTEKVIPKHMTAVRIHWSANEIELFEELFQKYGPKFTKISAEMKTRSSSQCRSRYSNLKKKQKGNHSENGKRKYDAKDGEKADVKEKLVTTEVETSNEDTVMRAETNTVTR